MISEIITTLVLQVNGREYLPFDPTIQCECIPKHRSVECSVSTLLTNGNVYTVVTAQLNNRPTSDEVLLECRQ